MQSEELADIPLNSIISLYLKRNIKYHGHIMVIITENKSGDFYLKRYHIEYISPKIKYCPIEFDIDSINNK